MPINPIGVSQASRSHQEKTGLRTRIFPAEIFCSCRRRHSSVLFKAPPPRPWDSPSLIFSNGPTNVVRSQIGDLSSRSLDTHVTIISPFESKRREEILFDIRGLGFEYTFSCLNPKGYQHCGDCYKCHERKVCFFKTGITDKTHYHRSTAAVAVPV